MGIHLQLECEIDDGSYVCKTHFNLSTTKQFISAANL